MTQQVPQPPRLAGYSYVRVLGHGSTATVYLYRQQGIERDVAVKVSVEQVDGRIADAFRAEARAMAALPSHPSILSTYDAGVTDDGRYYLVFEYAPGGTLKDVLCDHVLDVPHMLSMGVHLAGAVATAHRAGIVHRDIKTSNVLITGQQLPALADFGIAVTAYDHSSTGYSLPWAPPETLRTGGAGGEAADIYSLGAVLYASLVGTSPFEYGYHPKTAKELAKLIMTQPLPTIQRNDVPTAVCETLARAMAANADDRYPSALAFARALQQVQFELYGHATSLSVEGADPYPASIVRRQITERPLAARQRGRYRKAWMVVGITVALLTLFLAVFMGFVLPGLDTHASGNQTVVEGSHGALRNGERPEPTGNEPPGASVVPSPQQLSGSFAENGAAHFHWRNPDPREGDTYVWSRIGAATTPGASHVVDSTEFDIPADQTNQAQVCVRVSIVRADRSMSAQPATACAVRK